jgi:hypothetical protein
LVRQVVQDSLQIDRHIRQFLHRLETLPARLIDPEFFRQRNRPRHATPAKELRPPHLVRGRVGVLQDAAL